MPSDQITIPSIIVPHAIQQKLGEGASRGYGRCIIAIRFATAAATLSAGSQWCALNGSKQWAFSAGT